jgi:hypothetical protein
MNASRVLGCNEVERLGVIYEKNTWGFDFMEQKPLFFDKTEKIREEVV